MDEIVARLANGITEKPSPGVFVYPERSTALQEFDYVYASDIPQVVSLLSDGGDQVRLLSGGTDLLVQLRDGRHKASLVVDVKGIPELNELAYSPEHGLYLGAALPCQRICADPQVSRHYPGLVDAVSLIGGTQIQSRATLGGNLSNASPAADSIPALIVQRAICSIAGPAGNREVPVEDFCVAPGQTVLGRGEFLISLWLPPPEPRSGACYLRFIPRNEMDIAVAGSAASLTLDEGGKLCQSARIALSAVAPRPLYVPEAGAYLAGKAPSRENFEACARLAQAAAQPITDMRGSAAQRKHLAGVLTRRALEKALERAQNTA